MLKNGRLIMLLVLNSPVNAEIIIDGTLGMPINLPGPDFQIEAQFGQQVGGNLFHSFQDFNLQPFESATFSGPNRVQNVISRVTGGNSSHINGLIRSTISHADMYFINPYGMIFGPHAQLDVQGSFHASTADYLRLQGGGRFEARQPHESVLTVTPVEAFGFLTDRPASLLVEGQGEIPDTAWDGKPTGLSVLPGNTLSLIGGNIELKNGTYMQSVHPIPVHSNSIFGEPQLVPWAKPLGSLNAPEGQINLISVSTIGEVGILAVEKLNQQMAGKITLSDHSQLDVSGRGAGNIFIRGGQFVADNSYLYAKTFADQIGGVIDIQAETIALNHGAEIDSTTFGIGNGADINLAATESLILSGSNPQRYASKIRLSTFNPSETGTGGNLHIEANRIEFMEGAIIANFNYGNGKTGKLTIHADKYIHFSGVNQDPYARNMQVLIFGDNYRGIAMGGIYNSTFDQGPGSDIFIATGELVLADANSIWTGTLNAGDSGNIDIRVTGAIQVKGSLGPNDWVGGISTGTYSIGTQTGRAGNLFLQAQQLSIEDGSFISSSSATYLRGISGKGGNLHIQASEIKLSGANPYGRIFRGIGDLGGQLENIGGSVIVMVSFRNSAGAGNITLEADSLLLENGGTIIANSFSQAKGGEIDIRVRDSIQLTGTATIPIIFPNGTSQTYTFPSAIQANSTSPAINAGAGGKISVSAPQIVSEQGKITTSTLGGGNAGDITLEVNQLQLTNQASISSESASLEQGGDAGTITINANTIRLEDNSMVTTEALSAGGGAINLNSQALVHLAESQITSSVQRGTGNGGNVTIENPTFVISNHSKIVAQAHEGHGGNIRLVADNFLTTPDSLVSASSRLGVDGEILIKSPNEAVSGHLFVLPTGFIDVSGLLPRPCEAMTLAEYLQQSSFRVNRIAGNSLLSPFDLKPIHPLILITNTRPSTPTVSSTSHPAESTQPLALLTGCRKL